LHGLADSVERIAIAVEKTIQRLDRFADDKKLTARIKELRARYLHSR